MSGPVYRLIVVRPQMLPDPRSSSATLCFAQDNSICSSWWFYHEFSDFHDLQRFVSVILLWKIPWILIQLAPRINECLNICLFSTATGFSNTLCPFDVRWELVFQHILLLIIWYGLSEINPYRISIINTKCWWLSGTGSISIYSRVSTFQQNILIPSSKDACEGLNDTDIITMSIRNFNKAQFIKARL